MPIEPSKKNHLEKSKQVLFLSVDISGSTAYKHKKGSRLTWGLIFKDFYEQFPVFLEKACRDSINNNNHLEHQVSPKLWKSIGDELVFCSCPKSPVSVKWQILAFVEAIKQYSYQLGEKQKLPTEQEDKSSTNQNRLGLKATAWLAEIPTVNECLVIERSMKKSPDSSDSSQTDSITAAIDEENFANLDFIGPSIDTGFRLSKYATTEKCVLSVEIALLLASCGEAIYFDGFHEMKGVLDNTPYPIFWLEITISNMHKPLYPVIRTKDIENYCRSFIQETIVNIFGFPTLPYFREEDSNTFNSYSELHKELYDKVTNPDSQDGYEQDDSNKASSPSSADETSKKSTELKQQLSNKYETKPKKPKR